MYVHMRVNSRTATRTGRGILLSALVVVTPLVSCGGGADEAIEPGQPTAASEQPFLALVDADGAEAILAAGGVEIIDVRTPEEFAEGHLPGAELIDISAPDFVARIEALDRSATYFVYCRSDNRSGQATALMADLGFESIYELEGGTVGWEASGRALATG